MAYDVFVLVCMCRLCKCVSDGRVFFVAFSDVSSNVRASFSEVREDPIINLKYKSCFAQISDFKRKFLDAAAKYYELSHLVADKEQQR